MTQERQTLGAMIDVLTVQTGAAQDFADTTRRAFIARGVPLDSDAEPFFMPLIETFRREQRIRESRAKAVEGLARLDESTARLQAQHDALKEQLRALRERLDRDSAAD